MTRDALRELRANIPRLRNVQPPLMQPGSDALAERLREAP